MRGGSGESVAMSWLSVATSIIRAAFPAARPSGVAPPAELKGARIGYLTEGRSGKVVFSMGLRSFDMYFEFGGGDTLAVLDVPAAKDWEKATGFPVSLRPAILEFIGKSVAHDQVSSGRGRFEIDETSIRILS